MRKYKRYFSVTVEVLPSGWTKWKWWDAGRLPSGSRERQASFGPLRVEYYKELKQMTAEESKYFWSGE